MDVLAEKLDERLRQWKPDTAAEARERIAEVIELADHDILDIARDETGLTGYYDGELEFQTSSHGDADGQFPQAPTLSDALIEQAGLTLELRKAPGKLLVIRSSDRAPTDN